MSEPGLVSVVLAAGAGTRMKTQIPKVLHTVAGRPMIRWPLELALSCGASALRVVVGHARERVKETVAAQVRAPVQFMVQDPPRGTGDAVRCGIEGWNLDPSTLVLILYGDCPLVPQEAVEVLLTRARQGNGSNLAMLTSTVDDPTGYGRIVRDGDAVAAVVEERVCTESQRGIQEVNPGIYAVRFGFLREALSTLDDDNAQGEILLTDLVALAHAHGGIHSEPWPMADLTGVNNRWELCRAEERMQRRLAERWALEGVTFVRPESIWLGADVVLDRDVTIYPGVVLRGDTRVGPGATVDVGCVLDNVRVGAGAVVKPHTVAADSVLGEGAQVGPFTHIRPRTELAKGAKLGNFVEAKNTKLGEGSKANHLSYLGDGVLGDHVNVGAGTIFCNYDGYNKHTTYLDDHTFIGCDSQFVAPVRVGKGSYVATGTTVTRDVPENSLAIGRTKQENKEGYASRLRAKLEAQRKGSS